MEWHKRACAGQMPDEIFQAVRNGNAAAVRDLLAAAPSVIHSTDEHHKTPLHWAAELDRADIAAALIEAGADIEAATSWSATPLDWAANMGSTKVADLLLAHGAKGMNLVTAASLGKTDLVRELLASGASPGRRAVPAEPNDHWPADAACMRGDVISDAFYSACRNGHRESAALLLERGADVNAKGVFGATGLHWAAINGHADVVAFLLEHGADATIRDAKFNSTAREWAAEGGHDGICKLIRGA